MKIRFLYILLLFTCNSLWAQENKDVFTTTVRYHYGAVLSHHKSISYLVNDQTYAVELNFGCIPSKERSWARLYNQPEIGIGLYHGNLGNDKILGQVTAVFPYLNFPLKRGKRWDFTTQLGMGLAYTEKHFDPIKNFSNVAIGSKLNAFIKATINTSLKLNNKFSITTGFGICHLSNGAFSIPNKGLNILNGNIGLKYNFKDANLTHIAKHKSDFKLENQILITFNTGFKQIKAIDQHKYRVSNLSLNYRIGLNSKHQIGFGLDLFYDKSANRGYWDKNPQTAFKDRFSQALFVSHDLSIQKLDIIIHFGVYTLYTTKPPMPVYTRLGLRYHVSRCFFTNLGLKAHLGKADYIEFGIGYQLTTKRHAK